MEACVVICRMHKPAAQRGKILFINAVNEVTRERAQSFLEPAHQARIAQAYRDYVDVDGFARVVDWADIRDGNLNIALYVRSATNGSEPRGENDQSLTAVIADWQTSSQQLRESMDNLFRTLDEFGSGNGD
jgi:type I restriction enzyme M protein